MTSKVCRNLLALIHVIYLSMFNYYVIVDILSKEFEGVLGSRKKELPSFSIERIERNLENTIFERLRHVQSDATRAEQTALLPVPKQNLPVRGAA